MADNERIIIETECEREERLRFDKGYTPPTYMTEDEARRAGYVITDPQRHIPPRKIRHDA
jgi:hypothetical protein